jgi:two-component system OmpR family sensor kinase
VNPFGRLPVRLRATLGTTSRTVLMLLVVISAGFAATGYLAVERTGELLIEQVDERLIDDARATEIGLQTGAEGTGIDKISEIADALGGRQAMAIVATSGAILEQSSSDSGDGPDPAPALPLGTELVRALGQPFDAPSAAGGLRYRVLASRLPDGSILVLATPLEATQRIVTRLSQALTLSGFLILLVLSAFIWAVIRSANRQIDQMIDTAALVGAGDLTARVDGSRGGTEGARLAAAINAMTAQLEAAFVAREDSADRLRRFVADASHELRTPLAAIRGYAQLQQSGALSDPVKAAQAVQRIESEAARMGILVEELLLLAHLDQGRPLGREQIDLTSIVADSVSDARVLDPGRQIELVISGEPALIVGDGARLRQAVANLLANTRAHAPGGSLVQVVLRADEELAVLSVADDGPGMTEETAQRVFDRFFRAEPARTRAAGGVAPGQGLGLGLAIVSSVASAHGGSISVSTSPREGSTFTLVLPRGRGGDCETEAALSHAAPGRAPENQ